VAWSLPTGQNYYGRFYLAGYSIQGKVWKAGTAEPAWGSAGCSSAPIAWCRVSYTDSSPRPLGGNHYSQLDGQATSMYHRHSTMIVRRRVALEPTLTLGAEASGARADVLTPLAGPFRSLTVACFDAMGASIACSPATSVKAVQVTLVVMDASGTVPDLTLTGEALRERP